eukprot:Opistho-2@61852
MPWVRALDRSRAEMRTAAVRHLFPLHVLGPLPSRLRVFARPAPSHGQPPGSNLETLAMNDRIPADAGTLDQSIQLSREPLPASTKTHVAGSLYPGLRVPMRAIALTNGEVVTVYDPSGPYTHVLCVDT